MPSELKNLMAEELARRWQKGTDYVVVGYTKLSGPEMTELRKTFRGSQVRMEVVKNSVAVRALEAAGLAAGCRFLDGPSALVTGRVEMPVLCRLITDCARKYEAKLPVHGGMMGGSVLTPQLVSQLASIPPLPVLHARMAGSILAAVAGVAGVFQSLLRSLACALEGIRKQKEGGASPSDPRAAASEATPSGHA